MQEQIYFTDQYEKRLRVIEDFILEGTERIESVSKFLDQHDEVLNFTCICT